MNKQDFTFTDHLDNRVYTIPAINEDSAYRQFEKIMKSKHGKAHLPYNPAESEFETED